MADPVDSVDFSVIEEQKENIQSLPSGRSAKALANVLSGGPLSSIPSSGPGNETNEINAGIRQEFEKELELIDESDDPLDIYDRYVKWTLDAYPSAQATPQSGLLPLLERATKAFLASEDYKNDPRYLRLWLHYIRLFSEAPREVFAFLARHGIGERLALFYEEFAAWLESAGRFTQAEEIYQTGLEKGARPSERLSRKYREFTRRIEAHPRNSNEPTSPALPKVRPALGAKVDPFASARIPSDNQQQQSGSSNSTATKSKRSGKPKMQIFSDSDGAAAGPSAPGDPSKGWDSVTSLKDRKKENTYEPKPWQGQTLKAGKKTERGPKLQVFKDESLPKTSELPLISDKTLRLRETVNPRSGKVERIHAPLEAMYPLGESHGNEMSLDELRAAARGWLNKDWSSKKKKVLESRPAAKQIGRERKPLQEEKQEDDERSLPQTMQDKLVIHEGEPLEPERSPIPQRHTEKPRISPKFREVKGQTQTIKTKLDSPTGPKISKRKSASAEPTMTFHTRAATDEIYSIFNQPLQSELRTEEEDSIDQSQSDFYDEDDFTTTTGETTGRISGVTSDFSEGDTSCISRTTNDEEEEHSEDRTASVVPDSDYTQTEEGGQLTPSNASIGDRSQRDYEEDDEDDMSSPSTPRGTRKRTFPSPPDDYDAPVGTYRDPAIMAQNRLPFMTPIVEKTETSLAYSAYDPKKLDALETPSLKATKQAVPLSESPLTEPPEDLDDIPTQQLLQEESEGKIPVYKDESPSKLPMKKLRVSTHNGPLAPLAPASTRREPIIDKAQCEPINETIKARILRAVKPLLSSQQGYHEYDGRGDAYLHEIRRYIKSLAKPAKGTAADRVRVPQPIIPFEGVNRNYVVKRQLGEGGFASVYLVEGIESPDSSFSEDGSRGSSASPGAVSCRKPLEALKVEGRLNSTFEFYMLRLAHDRLAASEEYRRTTNSVTLAHELHRFKDQGFLVEGYRDQGTLIDLVNVVKAQPGAPVDQGLEECAAMFFSVELLRVMEGLHAVGILHGDVKADNCLVRLEATPNPAATFMDENFNIAQYSPVGNGIWSENGIELIDFGRGIDMYAFREDVQFIADWKIGQYECPEMKESRPWTYQIDLYGIATVMHTLLFGKHMEVVPIAPGAIGSSRTYRTRETLKRYWARDIWSEAFDLCLNPGNTKWVDMELAARGAEQERPGPVFPVIASMRYVRERMEEWLAANAEKRGLYKQLKRMEDMMSRSTKRRTSDGR